MRSDNDYWLLSKVYDFLTRFIFLGRYHRATRSLIQEGIRSGLIDPKGKCFIPGVGTGHLLPYLLELGFTDIVIYEPSEAMYSKLLKRMGGKLPRAITRVYSLKEAVAKGRYQLLFFHYYLDLFAEEELADLVGKYMRYLHSGAIIHLADFRKPVCFGWQKVFITVLVWFFICTTRIQIKALSDVEAALSSTGLIKLKESTHYKGLIMSSIWQK